MLIELNEPVKIKEKLMSLDIWVHWMEIYIYIIQFFISLKHLYFAFCKAQCDLASWMLSLASQQTNLSRINITTTQFIQIEAMKGKINIDW